ncbi:MAG: lipase/acyltransferase domain-containing protein [Acidobacteriota bacterium]
MRSKAPTQMRVRAVRGLRRFIGLSLLILAAGCSHREPDLALLYHDWANQKQGRPPLVGIHGLMGSQIVDPRTGKVLWGKMREFFSTTADMRLALPIAPGEKSDLVAVGSIKKVGGVEVYAGIVQTLTQDGGYTLVKGAEPVPEAPFFPFAYDWRLSCVENARRLSAFIDAIAQRCHDPSLKVDIVAHSMGGLIARYYILYGRKDVLGEETPVPTDAGAAHVRKLVMLGTPNMGAVSSLLALIDGSRVGLARIPPDLIATMPSIIQLMPSPSDHVLFTAAGEPVALDIYDVKTWERERWGIFDPRKRPGILRRYLDLHPGEGEEQARAYLRALQAHFGLLLQQAKAFHLALEAGPVPASIQTLLLGGDCTPTLRGLVVEREGSRWVVRRKPDEVQHPVAGVNLASLFYGPGDGDVTKSSLLAEVPASALCEPHTDLPYALSGFICEEHMKLVKNWTFRDNLLNFLLYKPLPAAAACRVPSASGKTAAPSRQAR